MNPWFISEMGINSPQITRNVATLTLLETFYNPTTAGWTNPAPHLSHNSPKFNMEMDTPMEALQVPEMVTPIITMIIWNLCKFTFPTHDMKSTHKKHQSSNLFDFIHSSVEPGGCCC